MPEGAAALHTPFINFMAGSMSAGGRFDSGLYVGTELGGFWRGRLRASLRAALPFGVSQPYGEQLANREFWALRSSKPALLWGPSVGVVIYSGRGFTLSVTGNFTRTDVGAYGNLLGVALPFEWVTRRGLRVGFEPGVMRGIGGEVQGRCEGSDFGFNSSPSNPDCDQGEIRAFNRESGGGVWAHFFLGIPYDSPEPVPVSMAEEL